MNLREFRRAGHLPSLLCAFLYFDVSFMIWVLIGPLANLVRSDRHSVYGILVTATHAELARLYDYARDQLGGTYLPEAVLAEAGGRWRPALCYLAPRMEPGTPSNDYLDRIVVPARQHGFPAWYLARLEAFRPA